MAQILLDVNNGGKFQKGDILVFDGKNFIAVNKDYFLQSINMKIEINYKEIEELREKINKLEHKVAYYHGEEENN